MYVVAGTEPESSGEAASTFEMNGLEQVGTCCLPKRGSSLWTDLLQCVSPPEFESCLLRKIPALMTSKVKAFLSPLFCSFGFPLDFFHHW